MIIIKIIAQWTIKVNNGQSMCLNLLSCSSIHFRECWSSFRVGSLESLFKIRKAVEWFVVLRQGFSDENLTFHSIPTTVMTYESWLIPLVQSFDRKISIIFGRIPKLCSVQRKLLKKARKNDDHWDVFVVLAISEKEQ